MTAAWEQVGVTGGATTTPVPGPVGAGAVDVVRVKRSGGFTGRTEEGEVSLDDADEGVLALVQRIDLDAAAASAAAYRPMPDMFIYTFQVADGDPVTLPEQALSGDMHELAALVLRGDR